MAATPGVRLLGPASAQVSPKHYYRFHLPFSVPTQRPLHDVIRNAMTVANRRTESSPLDNRPVQHDVCVVSPRRAPPPPGVPSRGVGSVPRRVGDFRLSFVARVSSGELASSGPSSVGDGLGEANRCRAAQRRQYFPLMPSSATPTPINRKHQISVSRGAA